MKTTPNSVRKPHRLRRAMTRVIAILAVAVLLVTASPTRADAFSLGWGEAAACAIPVACAGIVVKHLTGDDAQDSITEDIAHRAEDAIAQVFMDGTITTVNWVLIKVTTASTPVVNGNANEGDWFAIQYQMMMNVGWWVMLPLLFVSILHSIIKGSMALLMRSICMYLPLAVLGTVVATTIIQMLIQIVDDMCAVFIHLIAKDLANYQKGLSQVTGAGVLGIVMGMAIGLILMILSLYLWLVFLLRDGSVYIAVMFMPVGFAMLVWPMAARYFRKMVEFLVGIIVAKLVMVIIISLSIAALAGSTGAVTAGMQVLYPDGGYVQNDSYLGPGDDGIAGTKDDEHSSPPSSDNPFIAAGQNSLENMKGFIKALSYLAPAVVMLGLAALSPPMTIKLVGNLGLGEMASTMADTLNTQSWLYQYIGMQRQTKIWFTQPKAIYNKMKAAHNQKKALKQTSKQEWGLNAYKVYRNAEGHFGITKEEAMSNGATEAMAEDIERLSHSEDANDILAAHMMNRNADQIAEVDLGNRGSDSTVIRMLNGDSLVLKDIVDRQTGAPIRYFDSRSFRRTIDQEAQWQLDNLGSVQGIYVMAPVRTFNDPTKNGRVVGVNKQQESWEKSIARELRDARDRWGSDNIKRVRPQHRVADRLHQDPNEYVENVVYNPTQGEVGSLDQDDYGLAG